MMKYDKSLKKYFKKGSILWKMFVTLVSSKSGFQNSITIGLLFVYMCVYHIYVWLHKYTHVEGEKGVEEERERER